MKTGIALLALALCCSAAHRQATIPSGSAIYVDSKNGFDKFLEAAFQSRHVPLRAVSSPENAYLIRLTAPFFPTWDVVQTRSGRTVGSKAEAAVTLTSKAGEVVWRHTVSEGILKRGGRAVAEECAKHMKDLVAKGP